jgi:type IV pilus assembly protein PilN
MQIYYLKLRVYLLGGIGIVIALLLNGFIFAYYQVHIIQQESRNTFLTTNLDIINKKLQPINDFNTRSSTIERQFQLLKSVEDRRDDLIGFFQNLESATPKHVYLKQLSMENGNIQLVGTAASPLYLASLLDGLRNNPDVFVAPELISNNLGTNDSYDFVISLKLKRNLVAQ